MSDAPEVKPARPQRLSFRFAREDDRLALRFGRRPSGHGWGLGLWLIGWTVGCVVLVGVVVKEPKVFTFLFAVPFWASWIFVFCLVLNELFNCEYVLLDRQGLAFERWVLVRLSSRRVPLEEIQSFASYEKNLRQEGSLPPEGIEAQTLGKPLLFGEAKSDEEKAWLLDQLNEHLAVLHGGRPGRIEGDTDRVTERVARAKTEAEEPAALEPIPAGRGLALKPSPQPVSPPSDCRWMREDSFSEISLFQEGKFSPSAVGGLLFINLFWNGIVSVFVGVLLGVAPMDNPVPDAMWWCLFFFLIPFEVIGAIMFFGLLIHLFEPVRRTRWTFGRGEIQCRWTWLGIGLRRRYEFLGLDRLEISESVKKYTLSSPTGKEPGHRLKLIDADNVELCSINKLTEGEARWIGDVLLRERPLWFGGR
ncbi:MAG: hypothetical protein JXB10_19980 [Pirellulales bacterium]|nr:hypothetical protein [Pirellulales bacterium]